MPEKTVQKEPGKKPVPSKKPKPQQEVVVQISLSELHPFPDHPFQVREDASMQETAESVKEYGVLVPALARPREDGGYELIAGHRRKHACELAGLATMPVIVRDIDRDAATIIMVDSNLQRENILPSERAKAYKMKMEAIKRQGARTDLTSPKISAKFRSDDEVGQDAGVSGDTMPDSGRKDLIPMKHPLAYITAPWSENEFENTENAAKYCRAVYDAGFSPVCPTLFLPLFLRDEIPQEHKDCIDMAREYLRRARVLVVCGSTVDESVKNDIAVAERLRITATTLDGILTVKGQGRRNE